VSSRRHHRQVKLRPCRNSLPEFSFIITSRYDSILSERTFNANAETYPQCIRLINQSLHKPEKPRDESPDMTVATQAQVNITVLREDQAKQKM
jgi:hypothetical protein